MRVFIHGSCVSRDLLPLLSPHGFELTFYSPRQSLIGLLGPVPGIERAADLRALASRFQRRAAEGTLRADVIERLEHHHDETDMVLWDLTDERLGVYELNGGYVTRSLELMNAGLDTDLRREARHIPFGSDEHFTLWTSGLRIFAERLKANSLDDRVVLVAPDWADAFEDGSPTPVSFGITAIDHRKRAERYYRAAQAELPRTRILGRSLRSVASRDHQWGPAPFHLSAESNQALAMEMLEFIRSPAADFPLPWPVCRMVGGASVVVTARATWATDFALYVSRGRQTVAKLMYQASPDFRVDVDRGGVYTFRLFHRNGEHRKAVLSRPVAIHLDQHG